MNPRRLFVASCMALVASAFSFVIRQDVLPAWGTTFKLNATQLGFVGGLAFWGMAVSMAVGSFVVDALGMKKMLGLAFLSHLSGTVLTLGSPYLGANGYLVLCLATFLVGAANGFVEIGINPLAATLYPTEKTHMLNVLHAWWPGGLMIGGLISVGISGALGLGLGGQAASQSATTFGWQVKMALVLLPTILYGILFFTQAFPVTERVASGITTGEMFGQALRPMFLLWAFCMLLTASTELAPQGMQSLVLQRTAGMNGTYILIYTSLLMFLLRHFAGPIAHRLSPVGMLVGSSVLSAIGLFVLSFAYDKTTAIAAATIYGLGIVYFWPTMLGVTAERFPRGGAFLLGLMGCVGNIAVGLAQPAMGSINDNITISAIDTDIRARVFTDGVIEPSKVAQLPEAERQLIAEAQRTGAKWSFRYAAALPVLLIVLFTAIAMSDRARGGYKPESLGKPEDKEFTPAEQASDY
jgi:MFS family permease